MNAICRLSEIADFTAGFAFKSTLFNGDQVGLPIVRIRDVTRGRSETFYSGPYDDRYLVDDGDFLVGMDGEFNIGQWRGGKALLNQRVCRIDRVRADVDLRYLTRFLAIELKKIEDATPFVTVKHLSMKVLNAIQIPIPQVHEQVRIAEALDRVDALREKRRKSIALLDELTEATFFDMFGRSADLHSWSVRRCDEVCSRVTVGVVVKPASYYRDTGVPAIRSQNIKVNRMNMDDFVYISALDNETKLKKSRIRRGDVVLVRSGRPGTAAIVPPELDGANAIDVLIATPDCSLIHPAYLCYFINSDVGKRAVAGERRGQVQQHFNVKSLSAVSVPIPPRVLQEEFAARLHVIEQLRNRQGAHLAALDTLFASIQSRAFRGELWQDELKDL